MTDQWHHKDMQYFIIIRGLPNFVHFVGIGNQQIIMFNEVNIFYRCIFRLLENIHDIKMCINPQKLVSMNIQNPQYVKVYMHGTLIQNLN